jgi:hypothetical protein
MIWLANWMVSFLALFFLAFAYRFYDDLDGLLRTDLSGLLAVLVIGAGCSVLGVGVSLLLCRVLRKIDVVVKSLFFPWALSVTITVVLCVVVTWRLSILLTET